MRIRSFLMAILVTAGTLSACASTRVDPATEADRIAAVRQQLVRGIAGRDAGIVLDIYAPDASFLAPNAPPAIGHAQIRQQWENVLAMPNVRLDLQRTSVRVAESGDLANEVGTYQFSFDGPDGRVQDEGKYSVVLRDIDGQWKVATDIFNSSKPLPPPPAPAPPPPPAVVFDMSPDAAMQAAKALQWNDVNVPGFNPGLKLAALHGDPSGTGDYTIRLRFPDGYEFPPHWHPNAEHVTVLQGTFYLAMGERFDRAALKPHLPGDFLYAPAKMAHFGNVKGETVIQLHGVGPFEIHVVK